jgi:hypothetical protein
MFWNEYEVIACSLKTGGIMKKPGRKEPYWQPAAYPGTDN